MSDPEEIIREALRDYVGDGEGTDEAVLAAYEASIRERIAQDIEEAIEPDEADGAPHLWVRGMNDAVRIVRGATR